MRLWGALMVIGGQAALADAPRIVAATAVPSGAGWRFDVTIAHPDTGWEHYANGWRVEDADGNVLGLRVLGHPHAADQPFTRSLSGTTVPTGTTTVFIRSRCSVDGWSDQLFKVETK